jgi:RNA polymerase sigma-70 factor (ECF subfamily)
MSMLAVAAHPGRARVTQYNYEPATELRDLVSRAQSGDAEAFGAIYDRYVSPVYRYVAHRVGGDKHLAEDLTSNVFVRALTALRRFHWQGRDLSAWLLTIARHLVADHYKSSRYRLEQLDPAPYGHAAAPLTAEEGPDESTLRYLDNVRLLGAVNQLSETQRECIVLRFILGLSIEETAAVLGRSAGAVKALQLRATRNLRRLLPRVVDAE